MQSISFNSINPVPYLYSKLNSLNKKHYTAITLIALSILSAAAGRSLHRLNPELKCVLYIGSFLFAFFALNQFLPESKNNSSGLRIDSGNSSWSDSSDDDRGYSSDDSWSSFDSD